MLVEATIVVEVLVGFGIAEDGVDVVELMLLFTEMMLDILLLDPVKITALEDFKLEVPWADKELNSVEVTSVE